MKLLIVLCALFSMCSFAKEVETECQAMNEARVKAVKVMTKKVTKKKVSIL